MKMMSIKEILALPGDGRNITVHGWVRTKRESKNVCFLEISDGSTIHNIQVVVDLGNADLVIGHGKDRHGMQRKGGRRPGGVAGVRPGRGSHGRRHPRLRRGPGRRIPPSEKTPFLRVPQGDRPPAPRTNTFGAVARIRSAMSFAIHRFFHERGFFYVHTPVITGSDCEGAGQMFQVTTLPLEGPRREGRYRLHQGLLR